MVQVLVLSDTWLSRYGLLENFDAEITNWRKHTQNIDILQREQSISKLLIKGAASCNCRRWPLSYFNGTLYKMHILY